MDRVQSWEVSDEFWARLEPMIPESQRDPDKAYKRKPGAGRKRKSPQLFFMIFFSHLDAFVRNSEIIGEVVNWLPDDFRLMHTDVNWGRIRGF